MQVQRCSHTHAQHLQQLYSSWMHAHGVDRLRCQLLPCLAKRDRLCQPENVLNRPWASWRRSAICKSNVLDTLRRLSHISWQRSDQVGQATSQNPFARHLCIHLRLDIASTRDKTKTKRKPKGNIGNPKAVAKKITQRYTAKTVAGSCPARVDCGAQGLCGGSREIPAWPASAPMESSCPS